MMNKSIATIRRLRVLCTIFFMLLHTVMYAQTRNTLALTPPMGWNSWNYFGKEDINENIVREVIDSIVAQGLQKAGYEYIVVDGGWRDTVLAPNGELLAHPTKFPHGMKALADYAHSKGLKFGLHTVPGSHDCGCNKVGGWGVEEIHVKQLLAWDVDFIKLDRCRFSLDENPKYKRKDPRWTAGWNRDTSNIRKAYGKWDALLEGHPIVFSASAYRFYNWYPTLTNMGRTTGDIKSNQTGGAVFDNPGTNSVMTVALKNNEYAAYAKPGYWNDPDMLVTGKQGLTIEEQKAHFALWCIMSAPLMIGNDPRNMSIEEKQIITNKAAIAINQDPTEQGRRIKVNGKLEVWAKKLSTGDYAVLLLNRDADNNNDIVLNWIDIGIDGSKVVRDVFAGKELGKFNHSVTQTVAPHASVFLTIKNQ
jgi:alpha-galactosidase